MLHTLGSFDDRWEWENYESGQFGTDLSLGRVLRPLNRIFVRIAPQHSL